MGTIIGIVEPHKVAFFVQMTAISGIFRRLHSSDPTCSEKPQAHQACGFHPAVIKIQIKELDRRMESPSVEGLKLDPTAP